MQVKLLHRTAPSTLFAGRRVTAYRHITQEARSEIQLALDSRPVVVFMKGTPAEPQCGFSRAVIQVLGIHGVPVNKMKAVDVLVNDEMRSAIKEFSLVS
jgi:monothiol glutaredoxin